MILRKWRRIAGIFEIPETNKCQILWEFSSSSLFTNEDLFILQKFSVPISDDFRFFANIDLFIYSFYRSFR